MNVLYANRHASLLLFSVGIMNIYYFRNLCRLPSVEEGDRSLFQADRPLDGNQPRADHLRRLHEQILRKPEPPQFCPGPRSLFFLNLKLICSTVSVV